MKSQTNYKSLNNTKVRKSKRKLVFFGIFGLAIIFVGVVIALNIFKAKPHDSTIITIILKYQILIWHKINLVIK